MNIFIFSEDHTQNAKSHPDKLIVKMQLEAAQLINNAIAPLGYHLTKKDGLKYGYTHKSHPCSLWLCENRPNLVWGIQYFESLVLEYEYRYSKVSGFRTNLAYLKERFSTEAYGQNYPPVNFVVAVNDFWLKCLMVDSIIDEETYNKLLIKKRAPIDLAIKIYRAYLCYAKCHYSEWRYSEPPDFWMENLNHPSKYNGRFSRILLND